MSVALKSYKKESSGGAACIKSRKAIQVIQKNGKGTRTGNQYQIHAIIFNTHL